MKKLASCVTLISALNIGAAQAAETQACVSAEQANAIFTYILPVIFDAAGSKCSPYLDENAALLQQNSQSYQKYSIASEQAWPTAKHGIKIMFDEKMPESMDVDAMRPFLDGLVSAMVNDGIKPKSCTTISEAYTLLEPLPPANVGGLIGLFMKLGTDREKKPPIIICENTEK
ncbi:hypothetical protein [Sphingorhabdus sp. 109]|jgi:C1A family cysteine protease|uniref:hypothetical protein n=1 Tax=Sphingorhabdus sp. 109 TaxID=2653173 RepID=UPI0012F19C73|nr:hypothetical protein [Sphingorhabdus sp. 109]VWX57364.1 conserved exported hypothetical protein [Sphingorhabdus sp. 109]